MAATKKTETQENKLITINATATYLCTDKIRTFAACVDSKNIINQKKNCLNIVI